MQNITVYFTILVVFAKVVFGVLPADVAVLHGTAVHAVCDSCCQDGKYCGTVSEDTMILLPNGTGDQVIVPRGTNMTCMLRSRNVFGAVDGGLCVPSTFSTGTSIEDSCRSIEKVGGSVVTDPQHAQKCTNTMNFVTAGSPAFPHLDSCDLPVRSHCTSCLRSLLRWVPHL